MSKDKNENPEQTENIEASKSTELEENKNSTDEYTSEKNDINSGASSENHTHEQLQKITDLEKKLSDEKDRFLRLYSEFDNYKKRTMRERTELLKSAGEDVYKLILPALDDFERAIKANENIEDVSSLKEGFGLIYSKLKGNLKGLEEMKCTGELFDSEKMEAIANIPAPDEEMKSKVIDVLEKGYMLNGKVIRFAKVVVGN